MAKIAATEQLNPVRAAFLCAPSNTFITGQTVLGDGGMAKAF